MIITHLTTHTYTHNVIIIMFAIITITFLLTFLTQNFHLKGNGNFIWKSVL